MHVCVLGNAASIHVQRWALHFAGKGCRVTVISFQPGEIEGIRVHHLPARASGFHLDFLFALVRARRLVQEINPDILHSHYATSYGLAGALANRHPYIITAWGTDVFVVPNKSWVHRQIVRFAMGRADLVTSMASHMTNYLVDSKLCDANKIMTLPFGTDTVLFNPNFRTQEHRITSPVIICNRRLERGLDVDVFIRAIPEVMKQFPDALFIVASEGALSAELKKLAIALGVNARVEFTGNISCENMPEFLVNADVFVSPSPSDGNNISLCEAMACGAFPVVTDIPANRDWVTTNVNGLVFPSGNVTQLAECIVKALKEPAWRDRVIRQNFNIISESGSWEKHMAKMMNVYTNMAERALKNRAFGKDR